jgi:hypothetical protein
VSRCMHMSQRNGVPRHLAIRQECLHVVCGAQISDGLQRNVQLSRSKIERSAILTAFITRFIKMLFVVAESHRSRRLERCSENFGRKVHAYCISAVPQKETNHFSHVQI